MAVKFDRMVRARTMPDGRYGYDSKSTGVPVGVDTAAANLRENGSPGVMWDSSNGVQTSNAMPQGVEARARREAEANFMGPMMPGGASPVGNLNPGSAGSQLPVPGSQLPAGGSTNGLPPGSQSPATGPGSQSPATAMTGPRMGAGAMMRNANGDLTMAARDALDARSGYRRTDPSMLASAGGARPVGRSMNDPDRIAEQQRRRGNFAPIQQRAAMREGQEFQREMFGRQQGAMDARRTMDFQMGMAQDQQRFDQGLTMFQMETQRRADESEADFNRRMEAQRQQAEAGRITGIGAMPLPPLTPGGESPGYMPGFQTADGGWRPAGGGAITVPQAPQSGMMQLPDGSSMMTINGQPVPEYGRFQQEALPGPAMPGQPAPARTTRVDGGARMEAPKIQTVPDPTDELGQRKIPVIWNPETGKFERVEIVDRNGDGIDDRTQGGAGAAAGGAVSVPRTTAGGNKFKVTPRA